MTGLARRTLQKLGKKRKPYNYRPLKSATGEIRLITLLPGDMGTEIKIQLRVVNLREKLVEPTKSLDSDAKHSLQSKYEALSYTWGATDNPGRICIDGWGLLSVTRNLEEALQYLRFPDKARIFWVDAICINQQDLDERSQQVPKMGDIYTLAERVVVWLGPEADGSSLALKILDHIGSMVEVDWQTGTMEPSQRAQDAGETHWSDPEAEKPIAKQDVIRIIQLLQRQWFERLWIRQEVRLASNAILTDGCETISWDTFRNAMNCNYHGLFHSQKMSRWMPVKDVRVFVQRNDLVYGLCISDTNRDLMLHLFITRHAQCSDPRDRVYSLLSILNPAEKAINIVPNYRKTADEVFQDVFLLYVKNYQQSYLSLSILATVEPDGLTSSRPTWVPNWAIGRLTVSWARAHASGCSYSNTQHIGQGVLRTMGVKVDTVEMTDRTNINESTVMIDDVLASIRRLGSQWPNNDHEAWLKSYCRTLCCDLFTTGPVGFDPIMPFADFEVCCELFRLVRASADIQRPLKQEYHKAVNNALTFMRHRALFLTGGSQLGLGPASSAKGDEIVVFPGCSSPMVLRPLLNGRYQVIGECFVPGIMHGEALLGPLPERFKRIMKLDYGTGFWEVVYRTIEREGSISTDSDLLFDPRFDSLQELFPRRANESLPKNTSGVLMHARDGVWRPKFEVIVPGLRPFDLE